MICSGDPILILDANVILDVAVTGGTDFIANIRNWLSDTVERATCHVGGKTVTLLASTRVLSDYATGASRRRIRGAGLALRFWFRKSRGSRVRLECSNGTVFAVPFLVQDRPLVHAPRRLDRFDRPLIGMLDASLRMSQFNGRPVLLASNDWNFLRAAEEHTVRVHNRERHRVKFSDGTMIISDFSDH